MVGVASELPGARFGGGLGWGWWVRGSPSAWVGFLERWEPLRGGVVFHVKRRGLVFGFAHDARGVWGHGADDALKVVDGCELYDDAALAAAEVDLDLGFEVV